MGRSSKFTGQQKLWLTSRLAEFCTAQDSKKLAEFWRPFYAAWYKDYPFVDPDQAAIEAVAGDIEKAKADKLQAEKTVRQHLPRGMDELTFFGDVAASLQLDVQPFSCVDFRYRAKKSPRPIREAEEETATVPGLFHSVLRVEMEGDT
jgi:hypothetical protein